MGTLCVRVYEALRSIGMRECENGRVPCLLGMGRSIRFSRFDHS